MTCPISKPSLQISQPLAVPSLSLIRQVIGTIYSTHIFIIFAKFIKEAITGALFCFSLIKSESTGFLNFIHHILRILQNTSLIPLKLRNLCHVDLVSRFSPRFIFVNQQVIAC